MKSDLQTGVSASIKDASHSRYALIFRTHFWDAFAQRQFDRVSKRARCADIYVLVDETRGKIEGIGAKNVFGLTDDQIIAAGFVAAETGSTQWYSGDVPLYMFYKGHPNYDYYVQLEYDVNVHIEIDDLVRRLETDGVDVLGLTPAVDVDKWFWYNTCLEEYKSTEIRPLLICLSAFSNRGIATLYRARLEQADKFRAGELSAWPYCEGFVASEGARQGLKLGELSDYGSVAAYDWWPPFIESDLPILKHEAFVHPVLDRDRYVASLFKQSVGLGWLLAPNSWIHAKLRRLGFVGYIRVFFGDRFGKELKARLSELVYGMRRIR